MKDHKPAPVQGIHRAEYKRLRERLDELLDLNWTYHRIQAELKKSFGTAPSDAALSRYRQRREGEKLKAALRSPASEPQPNTITIEIAAPANIQVRIITKKETR